MIESLLRKVTRTLSPYSRLFWAAYGWEGGRKIPLPKIVQIYPIMMKFGTIIAYLKKIQKIYKSRDTPPEFCLFYRKS